MQLRVMRSRKAAASMFHLIGALFVFILGAFFILSLFNTTYGQIFGENSGFDTFVDDLDEAMEGETGDVSFTTVEVQEGMAYIAMNPGENFVWDTSTAGGNRYPFFGERFERPSECAEDKTCLCKCTDVAYDYDRTAVPEERTTTIECSSLSCESTDYEFVEEVELNKMFTTNVISNHLREPGSENTPSMDVHTIDYSTTTWQNGAIINNAPLGELERESAHVFSGFKEPSQIRDVYIVKESENKMRLCFDADVCFDNT